MTADDAANRRSLPVVRGFRAAGLHCGIKPSAPDLALVASDRPATVAGVFTRSTVVGAPVVWCRERVRSGTGRALVVTSGISNVATGAPGRETNRRIASATAKAVGCGVQQTFVGATGVIGEPLPLGKVRRGIAEAARSLSPDGLDDAAHAILTTDTVAKRASRTLCVDGRTLTIAGMAKGSGMIEPRMATMLAYLFTDARVSAPFLRRCLRAAADISFNRLTIDGETSTSDMALVFANGAAGGAAICRSATAGGTAFEGALVEVCQDLARQLARDGEGATRLITVIVRGARGAAQAEAAARRIGNSLLVKTAIFGGDPNWGRILQTIGAGGIAIRESEAAVRLAGVLVYSKGRPAGAAARRRAAAALAAEDVSIEVELGAGRSETTLWTCDLSYDYVRINAEYTT